MMREAESKRPDEAHGDGATPRDPVAENTSKGETGHRFDPFSDTISQQNISHEPVGETEPHVGHHAPAPQHVAPPQHLGRYKIVRELGYGAFGAVFVAHDTLLHREVAIKVPRGPRTREEIQDFLTEARRLAQLQHPSIVTVHDVGAQDGTCYIVTDLLQGRSLSATLKERRLSWPEAVRLVATVADALGHAHARSMIHRDVKPGNIFLTDEGLPILLDFGLALSDIEEEMLGTQAGTPSYMAPEQVEGQAHRVDGRTDIYSLGVVLYELICGRPPFRAPSVDELFRRIREDDPQPPRQLAPAIPPELERICLRALAKSLSGRYTTAGDFAAALRGVLEPDTSRGSPVAASPLEPDVRQVEPASSLRRRMAAHKRHVTIAVFNFEVTDANHESTIPDAEYQHELVQAVATCCREAVQAFGGTVLPSTGQEVVACFGFPVSYENAAERAVRAALQVTHEAQSPASQLSGQIHTDDRVSVWAAIHSGTAVVEGGNGADDLSLVGDARTVASRMEPLAESGTITVSDETERLLRGQFETECIGKRQLRGVAQPITLYVVRRATGSQRQFDRAATGELSPLVGRDTELAILRDRWEYAADGQGQVVLLIGEAGLGKSRLVQEIRQHVAPNNAERLIEWNCSPYRVSSSLHPAIEYLQQLLEFGPEISAPERLARLRRHLEPLGLATDEQLRLLAALLSIPAEGLYAPVELSPQRLKERTQELLLDWLRELAASEPVLFIVEDLHWIDASSLELLELMLDAAASERILMLLTFRTEFEPPWSTKPHQTQVALNRLTRRQVRELVKARIGGDDPADALVDRILERTDGIPLFVEEFAKIAGEAGQSLDEIPVTLQDLLLARLDRMHSDLSVIQLAGVLGREFPYEQLQAVSELAETVLREELSKLVAAEILFQKGRLPKCRFLFKHALLQDAAYQSLLRKPRQEFHQKIAETLESRFPEVAATEPELLAQHYTAAGATAKAIECWLAAGQRSQGRSANQEAIQQYRAGLAVIETLPASPERDQTENGFRLSLVTAIMAARGYAAPEVQPELQRTRELSQRIGNQTQLLHVLWFIWAVQLIRAELDDALATGEEMLRLAESADDDGLRMEASFAPACTCFFRGEFDQVVPAARRGLALYDRERCRSHAQFTGQNSGVTLRNFEASGLWHLGFPDQARAAALQAVQLSKDLEHPFSQVHGITEAAWVHYFCRLGPETQRLGEEALSISANHDFPFWEACAGVTVGGGLILQGRHAEGLDRVRQALKLFRSTGGRVHECFIYAVLVEGLQRSGHFDESLGQIDEAIYAGNSSSERYMHAELLRLKGEVLLAGAATNDALAERCFHESIDTARRQSSRSWELRTAMSLARLWLRQGQPGRARELLTPIRVGFTEGFETPDLVDADDLLRQLPGS